MDKLIRLPVIGDWIDPYSIKSVRVFKGFAEEVFSVSIRTSDEQFQIQFESLEKAQEVRDDIAALANDQMDEE